MIDVAGGNAVYYYHFDGLGSVAALSNNSGQIVEHYEYDVFGEVSITASSGQRIAYSDVNNPYCFTGRRLDSEAGLYYYRARYYNPDLGRFLQTDPVGYTAGLNLYTYVDNNPINWIDPYGHLWSWASTGVGAAAGAVYGFVSGVVSEGRSAARGEGFNWRNVGERTGKGAITGAVAGAVAGMIAGDPSAAGALGAIAGAAVAGAVDGSIASPCTKTPPPPPDDDDDDDDDGGEK